jgi:hypothetical protein
MIKSRSSASLSPTFIRARSWVTSPGVHITLKMNHLYHCRGAGSKGFEVGRVVSSSGAIRKSGPYGTTLGETGPVRLLS